MPRRVPRSSDDIRLDVLSRVNTSLGFFMLGLLMIEGILAVLITQVEGSDRTLLLYEMLISLILLIVSVLILALKPTPDPLLPPATSLSAPPVSPPPDDVGKLITEITANTGKSKALGFGTLKSEILRELSDLAINARQWKNGELHTSSDRYNAMLLRAL